VFVTLGAGRRFSVRSCCDSRTRRPSLGPACHRVSGSSRWASEAPDLVAGPARSHGASGLTSSGCLSDGTGLRFGWTPCIGPILGAILTVTAVSESLPGGVALLAVYSLGLGIPFLLTGVFTASLLKRLKLARRAGFRLQKAAAPRWLSSASR